MAIARNNGQKENELKLSGSLNNQLKYVGDAAENVLEKLYKSLDLLGITYSAPARRIEQKDTYYDTRQHVLERTGCSLRIRKMEGEKYLTAKRPVQTQSDALHRTEYEEALPTGGQPIEHVTSYFREHFPEYGEEQIVEILRLRNIRHEIKIATSCGNEYTLCFDKYDYYFRGEGCDPLYEIELEQIGESSIDQDPDIQRLSVLFTDLMGFQVEKRSKYKKGIEWLENKDKFENKIFVLFDFVAYSQKQSSIQRQLVRDFTDLIQSALKECALECIRIPIGDGMILGCPADTNIVRFLNSFFGKLRRHNQDVSDDRVLDIRTALHYGPIYEYMDINGNLNFAGSGINLVARISSQTEENQVLISADCAQYLLESRRIQERFLSAVKEITVKHNVVLPVRNYYDPASRVGCP